MMIRHNNTVIAIRAKTKTYLQNLESNGRWLMRNGSPASPSEVFDTLSPFTSVVALPVISISDVIEDALREVDNAKYKVKNIAERSTINIDD